MLKLCYYICNNSELGGNINVLLKLRYIFAIVFISTRIFKIFIDIC
jgi:hypothetical protein